jgi:superfamily II DNA or RNA helicase
MSEHIHPILLPLSRRPPHAPAALSLRPYQERDIAQLRQAYAGGARAVLYQLPTGGGKTVVFAHIINGAARKGRRSAIVVHRRELIRQASDKLAWAGVPHGIVAAGLDCDHGAPTLVLSVQTAIRRLDRLPHFDFMVIDEAHHARAETWSQLLPAWPAAKLLGVSATPARTDGKGLGVAAGGLFDAVVAGASVTELQAEGYLARTRCFAPTQRIDTTGLRTRLGDYEPGALAERANAVTGDAVAEYRKHADHLPAIVYGCTVAHAEAIAAAFRSAGYRAACVHGGLPLHERDRLIAGLGAGEVEIICSCDLISEGLDVPNVGAVILLRPTQSLVLAMQQIGRGMRPAPDKSHLVVLDHAGNVLRHGLPEQPRTWTLDSAPKPPPRATDAPGWRCEKCGCFNQLEEMACAECGTARPLPRRRTPEVIDGRLREIGASHFERIVSLPYREFISGVRTEHELRVYARNRGYRRGWVWHRLREQQHVRDAGVE